MASERIEELVETRLRRELDDIAVGLGLDPSAYPNKRAIAEAIAKAEAEAKEKEKMEREVKKMMEAGTVKAKMNAIKQFTAAMQSKVQELADENAQYAASFQSKVQEQADENKAYVKQFYG